MKHLLFAIALAALTLTGCSTARNVIAKAPADEFPAVDSVANDRRNWVDPVY